MSMKITASISKIRREAAAVRQAAYDALSTKEKIEALDRRFGVGQGAKKVRAKLSGIKVEAKEDNK